MNIRVLKFGGTSLANDQARLHVVDQIKKAIAEGVRPIVVVSAMGRKGDPYATDTLLSMVNSSQIDLPNREIDLLLSCGEIISAVTLCSLLYHHGMSATVLTGAQAGIQTDDQFCNARIQSIETNNLKRMLKRYEVVIVTGFQGKGSFDEVTTLGRGGSDTSATAIAGALQAERVDIFTDVDGVLTADPRVVADAVPLAIVTYDELNNLAHLGAKVIHPRAIEVAKQANIPILVRSTFSHEEGTLVTSIEDMRRSHANITDQHVTGIVHVTGITQIQILASQGKYELQLKVFKAMANHRISVDFISVNPSGVVYTVFSKEAHLAVKVLRQIGYDPITVPDCAKVSIVGGGMNGVPGVMAMIVEALTEQDIQILQSADSNASIWVLVKKDQAELAVKALHQKFGLHKDGNKPSSIQK